MSSIQFVRIFQSTSVSSVSELSVDLTEPDDTHQGSSTICGSL